MGIVVAVVVTTVVLFLYFNRHKAQDAIDDIVYKERK